MKNAYIGLGSNLADPYAQVTSAIQALAQLPHSHLVSSSPLYRSLAIGPGEQPDYINAVAHIATDLEPLALLDALQAIEHKHQRIRKEHWGPRTLDLDILLIDQYTLSSDRLTLPHPFLKLRNFVLYPLADIAPKLQLPDGTLVSELKAKTPPTGLERVE